MEDLPDLTGKFVVHLYRRIQVIALPELQHLHAEEEEVPDGDGHEQGFGDGPHDGITASISQNELP
jgi:hypothetical protein